MLLKGTSISRKMSSPTCIFCAIASTLVPFSPSSPPASIDNQDVSPRAFPILSTKHVLAFLDIMPLTRGHVLVIPRRHYRNMGDVGVQGARQLGQWLPIISRAVVRTVLGEGVDERGDDRGNWNVVQNNGTRASQTVPHVHFHIIPRPPLDNNTPAGDGWIMFGRGRRDELMDDDAEELAALVRRELAKEVRRVKEEEGIDLEDCEIGDEHLPRSAKL